MGTLHDQNAHSGGAACFTVVAKDNIPFSAIGSPSQAVRRVYQQALALVSQCKRQAGVLWGKRGVEREE